jgi:NADH-quinone oxidoreductase subunit M
MPDLNTREWVAIAPLVVLMVWMGVAAQGFLAPVTVSNARTLEQTKVNVDFRVAAPRTPASEVARAD